MEEKPHETQPASPPAPDPDIPSTFPTKMHPLPIFRSKWLLLLIAGFLIIFISVYTFQFLTERNQQKQTATVAPTISAPSPAVDLTTNWKAYEDKKGLYSLKYPGDFQLYQGFYFSVDGVKNPSENTIELAPSEGSMHAFDIIVRFSSNSKYHNIIDVANDVQNLMNCISVNPKDAKRYSLNSKSAIIFANNLCGPYPNSVVYALDNLYLYEITVEHDTDDRLVDQILSTFKFTEQQSVQGAMTQKNIVTVWKTYSLGKYDHFQYPADWIAKEDKNGFINLTPISQLQQAANKSGKVEKQATVIITGEGSEFPRKPTQQTSVAFTTMTVAGLISAKATITYLTNSEYPKGTKHIQVMIPGAGYIFFLNDIKYSDIFFNMLSSLILDNGEPPPLQGNPLPFVNFKVGALISGMTVSSVGPVYPEFPINSLNASVRFSGKQRLTGEYYKAYATHDICLDGIGPAKAVPTIVGIKLNLLHLCFDNQDVAKKLFKSQKENDRVTVVVNNYVMNITPNQEIPTTATLLSIERKKMTTFGF